MANRSRFPIACANALCSKTFYVAPGRYAKGVRCCSWQCRAQHMRLPVRLCQNPACGKPIERVANGPKASRTGRDSGKYCCTQCYHDHRWGQNRPRNDCAGKNIWAGQTSLRKKCKNIGAPYDPECTRVAVCERDGWVCQKCGIDCLKVWTFHKDTRTVDPRSAEQDHIVPLSKRGGPGNVFPNCQCLCHNCNIRKRDTPWGQLRLDFEGSVKRWESVDQGRRQRNLKSSVATQAIGPSTRASRSRPQMAL